jgi:metallo-beta-lactamase class B
MFKRIVTAISLSFVSFLVFAQKVTEPQNLKPEWSRPYKPFRIAGNLYYVGTYELASYLITTPKGSILINSGLAASAPMIKGNIEALGFKFKDLKILLTNQVHFDHVGAMAAIKKWTGAKMIVDEKDAGVLLDGGSSDYAFGSNGSTFEPVKPDRLLLNGDTIKLANMQLVMLHHPGHTKGSCSFLFNVKDKHRTFKVLIANMPSLPTSKKFSDLAGYNNIIKDYEYTFDAMRTLNFDIWLSPHAGQFGLQIKHKPGAAYNPAGFMDRKGYDAELNDLKSQFDEHLKEK